MRSPRLPAVVLLLLCALPSRVAAQQFVCWPIAAGDTASSLARRLTGNAEAAYGLAFQIRDPARRMFVPKSHYQRLQSDWQACVAPGPVPKTPVVYAPVVELAASAMVPDQPIATTPQALASAPLTLARADRTLTDVPFAATIAAVLLIMLLVGGGWLTDATPHSTVGSPRRRTLRHRVCAAAHRRILGGSTDPDAVAVRSPQTAARDLHCARSRPSIPQPGRSQEECGIRRRSRHARVLGNYVLSRPPRAAGQVGRGDD